MNDLAKRIANLSPEKRALLEQQLAEKRAAGEKEQPLSPIRSCARNQTLPLSFSQERLWFLDQLEPGSAAYNISVAFRLAGPLNAPALEQSLNEIVQRHETLRTTFAVKDGQPAQVIAPALKLALAVNDLGCLSEMEREAQVRELVTKEAQSSFDLAQGPLLRAVLLRLNSQEHILLLVMHHIISDGWSMGVFNRELAALYTALLTGQPPRLAELAIQYADYARWQRAWLQEKSLERQLTYWQKQLGQSPPSLELPTDRPRPAVQTFRGATHSFMLPAGLTQSLQSQSRQEGVTLFMTLLAAIKVMLYRYTGQENIVVGTPVANRNRPEVEDLIGFFVNTLALRTEVAGNLTFQELVGQVRETTLDAFAHQDLPFEKLVEALQPERDMSRNPLFQVMFALQNTPTEPLRLPGLSVTAVEIESKAAQFDLTFSIEETDQGLYGLIEYNTDLFDANTIERTAKHYKVLLEGIVAKEGLEQQLGQLPLLTAAERHQLLVAWNNTATEYPRDKCIHELFEAQAKQTPDAVAVIFENQHVTYQELNRRANQLARHLRKLGVTIEVRVGICMERSPEVVIGLLGILKAGGAYVPLDPTYPVERLTFMLQNTEGVLLLTQSWLSPRFSSCAIPLICLDTGWENIAQESDANLSIAAEPGSMAYVIHTSGSTGTPKGVIVRHLSVINLINWVNQTFQVGPDDCELFITSLCFDLSVYDIFGLLAAGGSIQIPIEENVRNPNHLIDLMRERSITFWDSAPATLQQLAPFLSSIKPGQSTGHLRLVFLSGDWIPVTLPDVIRETFPQANIISLGGATEATIWSNYYPITKVNPTWPSIPYGKPIHNARYYVLDSNLNPCPIGVPGDLHIGGECLAWGYANQPNLTASKFIPDPYSTMPGARLYKTGDRARYWCDGNLEFLGRVDQQVKIRGFRIELGEIETVLSQHPAIREAIVQDHGDTLENKRLVAYIVPHHGQNPDHNELRNHLREKLPEYMIPSIFMALAALPLTPNGKIDRKALPSPGTSRPEISSKFVAPRTPIEEALAGIWAKTLRLERVGIYDNFFDLGGHSLLATQVVSRIRETLMVELPLRAMFEAPTVADLSNLIVANEVSPGQTEKIARILKMVSGMSDQDAKELLQSKKKE